MPFFSNCQQSNVTSGINLPMCPPILICPCIQNTRVISYCIDRNYLCQLMPNLMIIASTEVNYEAIKIWLLIQLVTLMAVNFVDWVHGINGLGVVLIKLDCYTIGSHCNVGLHDRWEFPPFLRGHWQSLVQPQWQANCLPLGLCKETEKV